MPTIKNAKPPIKVINTLLSVIIHINATMHAVKKINSGMGFKI